MHELLDIVSLRSFLNVYPGPAFAISSASYGNPTLAYGNPALHSLILGEGNTAILDDTSFFGAICDANVFRWLYEPIATVDASKASWNIDLRPLWLSHEHDPLRLKFTVTPIHSQLELSDDHLILYTAPPTRISTASLPFGKVDEVTERPVPISGYTALSEPDRTISRHLEVAPTTIDLPSSLLNKFPWEKTSLGPQAEWPESLKTMVQYTMAKALPSTLYWGWPDLVMIYNDAYATLVGSKHPSIYGQKASIAWKDQWTRVSSIAELYPLFFTSVTEFGYPREVYQQEDGSVGGILNSTYDTTQRVIAERRMRWITDFISQLAKAKTQDEVSRVLLDVVSGHEIDFPFAALYHCDSSDMQARPHLKDTDSRRSKFLTSMSPVKATLSLVGAVGIPENHPAAPQSVEYTLNPTTLRQLDGDIESTLAILEQDAPYAMDIDSEQQQSTHSNNTWQFPILFSSGKTEIISPLASNLTEGLLKRSFGDRPNSAALIPLPIDFPGKRDGPNLPLAILVVGLNPRLPYDDSYAQWLESIAVAFSSRLMVALQMEVDAALARERTRLDAAQTKFFRGVSHELRTPLTLIQAPLEQLAESKGLTPSAKGKVDLAMRNVERLRRLVESILDVSKLEAGQITGRFHPVQLDQVIADMTSLFRGVAERKGIELHIETQLEYTGPAPYTYIDIQLWEKIFYNLLSNAFKYTKVGKVTVSVSYDSTSAYLRVSDTGIGIPLAKQDDVFGLFHRLNDLPAEGSGVGLAVAKELVSLHGGRLSVLSRAESEYIDSTGSTFTVELPLGRDHLAPELVVDDKRMVPLSDPSFNKPNYWADLDVSTPELETNEVGDIPASMFFNQADVVLVVDNDSDMRSFLRSIFAPFMKVLEACDGVDAFNPEASSFIVLPPIGLIFRSSDILMPRLNGPEFLSKLRSEKKTMFIPVMFVTAVTDITEFFTNQTEGIVDCITKPFSIRDLLARSHLQLQIGKRRIKLENDFTERSSELQALTNLSPVGIFRADTTGRLTYTNPKWYQVTGYDTNQDRDEWLNHLHSESRATALQAWRECLVDGKSSSIRLKWASGTWTQFDIAPIHTPEGDYLGALGTITDITDLHRLEETRLALAQERERVAAIRADNAEKQKQAETERRKAQELLIDVASHELRQPVSAILQNADVVRANMKALRDALARCSVRHEPYVPTPQVLDELGEDIRALNNITQCGLLQERIANDILSLSKIQLDALSILPVAFELKSQVERILTIFSTELASKNISLTTEFGPGLNTPGFSDVFTDLGRLSQIVTNLMSNAIRFTEMSARLREIKVSVDVSSGPPIDRSCLPPPLTTQPLSPRNEPQTIYIYMSVQDSGPGLQQEDLALLFHRRQMKRAGFIAALASNGAEAVQAVSQAYDSPFDVILMDLQMPVMDGFTATKEIRRLEETGNLKSRNFIIAVTGNARAEQIQHARNSGVDDVIIKVLVLRLVDNKNLSPPALYYRSIGGCYARWSTS
ncbi:hypothetical protein FRC09_019390 [Ceratobasidium sp. 395]|nr:hypothetical protein FRC09_019390 [Ceratobasidium sp. 395]